MRYVVFKLSNYKYMIVMDKISQSTDTNKINNVYKKLIDIINVL